MQKEGAQTSLTEELSPLVLDIMRNLVAAIRAVKLYPPNNPVYSQTIRKAFESLATFLEQSPQVPVGVQKTYFLYDRQPVAKDTQLNKTVAQDLFNKGIREIVFIQGMTEKELLDFLTSFALSTEDLALRGGTVSILWEKGATHIKVTEAALEDVITTEKPEDMVQKALMSEPEMALRKEVADKEIRIAGRTLVLGDIVADPRKFGASMLDLAKETATEEESVEDRLQALYREAVQKVQKEQPAESETLCTAFAQSVIAIEPEPRDKFVTSKLYAEIDAEQVREQKEEALQQVPDELHEIVTGRFSKQWTVKQISVLLKKSAMKEAAPRLPLPTAASLATVPLPADIEDIANELKEYSPEEMETMKAISEAGMESDIIEATVRTLIFLLPLVQNSHRDAPPEKEDSLFSGVVHQLEDILSYLVKLKDYDLASIITRALRMPVEARFKPRMDEAFQKATSREIVKKVIADMHGSTRDSSLYRSAYAYLTAFEREVTPLLLELLADEKDRSMRRYLLDLVKDLGKNQMDLLGAQLDDERWYFVRNIVNILAESKGDQAISFLEKVANHKNHQIRLEVIKGLMSIGGKRAAGLVAKYLNDKDEDIRTMAVHGLGTIHGVGKNEVEALTLFVKEEIARRKTADLTLEGIRMLARIGDAGTQTFLQQYTRIRWWRPRKSQEILRNACNAAIREIDRRQERGGRSD